MQIEEFLQPSDEELYAYQSASDEDELEDDEDDQGDYEDEEPSDSKKPSSSRRRALSPTSSDASRRKDDDEDEITGWGSSKKDYYDADVIETEGDALEEEAEAKRIQLKRLQSMNEEDFGFDEAEWATSETKGAQTDTGKIGEEVTEVLPDLQIRDDMSAEDRLKILKQRYPEFEPLSKDFVDLQPLHQELCASVEAKSSQDFPSETILKWRALSAYLGAITMYFVLLTSPARDVDGHCLALQPAQLREHPIMETLIKCRKQWEEVRHLEEAESAASDIDMVSQDETTEAIPTPEKAVVTKKQKKTKAQKAAEKAQAESDRRRAERLRETERGLEELSKLLQAPEPQKKTSRSKPQQEDDDSDFGDEAPLTNYEAEEKARKKKSLRFYTSQIAQKANKRNAAGRDAGGDEDLPYRERLRDRQERLNKEAEMRGRREANELEKLGGDSDDDDYRAAQEIRGDKGGSDSDDYYDLVAARNKEKKESKKKLAEAHAAAALEGGRVEIQEQIGPDGKRAITYAIEKNKGLAPKRSKDVRNPRVKKRKKFEEKKKKLGSTKAIYKGGEGRGGYGGEMTGIKKNLVKSVKL